MLILNRILSRALRCLVVMLLGVSLLACSDDDTTPQNNAPPAADDNDGDNSDDDDNDDNDDGSDDDNNNDDDDDGGDSNEKPTASISVDGPLDPREIVTVTFSEAMNPDSLSVGGSLVAEAQLEWLADDTLKISTDTYWPAGSQTLVIDASDSEGLAMETFAPMIEVRSAFTQFQEASIVIGQQDFSSGFARQDPDALTASANTLDHPSSAVEYVEESGILYIGDTFEARVLGFYGVPQVSNANADFVIGQPDFSQTGGATSQDQVRRAQGIAADGDQLMIADPDSHRVTIYDNIPESAPGTASVVLGQENFEDFNNACAPNRMNHVHNQFVTPSGKLLVADSNNNRVLVWNEIPQETGVLPDLVIGQSTLDVCAPNDDDQNGNENIQPTARTLRHVTGIWSDDTRLVVADNYNHRVLLWHEFPTENFAPADVVLGQGNMNALIPNDDNVDGVPDAAPTARVVDYPWSVWFEKNQLFVADAHNNRVLIWNGWPQESFAPADIVLGQETFTSNAANAGNETPAANTLNVPMGVRVVDDQLLVTDTENSRVLIFDAQ